ncbi:MAG: hypothetical protein PWQ76_884, partial [Clostridiales bacterium]|nr:hypothetical protein [Clostridiales bacterium]
FAYFSSLVKKSRQGGFKNINIFKKIRRGDGVHPT